MPPAIEKVAKLQRSLSLRLYKSILASHRQLPPEMRTIGDLYVREEFQRHKTAKPEHLRPFFEQWLKCTSCCAVRAGADGRGAVSLCDVGEVGLGDGPCSTPMSGLTYPLPLVSPAFLASLCRPGADA